MSAQDNREHIQILQNGREYYDNENIAYLLPHDIDGKCPALFFL